MSAALVAQSSAPSASLLGAIPLWDDGLSEICFYDAQTVIYNKPRNYTRVHLLNREWFDLATGVKTEQRNAAAAPSFKLNIAEEIPTENYDYRLLTTLFVQRESLAPLKLTAASQEWCGSTHRQLRWRGDGVTYQSFSYFEGEAEQSRTLASDTLPFESIFLLAREFVARGAAHELRLLPPMRGTHDVDATVEPAQVTLLPGGSVRVPAGSFMARELQIRRGPRLYRLWVEQPPPYRLLRYEEGDERWALRLHERRAYWDRRWPSAFHRPGAAP